ncbi:MAG: hypothetical protein JO266_19430 [Acidobacteria bacterium]|nr:hypothetical protein [Acidobacteriota bacterium]MBV8894110.1 hypothetical protein [Acidobacteriota bacterium]MBV9479261.1 hypothetical protein [Acidobacteriota bacterium]
MSSNKRKPGIYLAWRTVTYRSVALIAFALLTILGTVVHLAFPQATDSSVKQITKLTSALIERLAGEASAEKPSGVMDRQAHFTNIEGTVRVKKASLNSWSAADYSLPLEKGDVVQTSSEGMAKIVFNDGTNYTVKQDSLIVIAENSANEKQQTNVAVSVTTGTVDLSTGTYVQGSSSKVMVGGATASLAPDSAAMVHNDPKSDSHEILVKKGSGEVNRKGETVHLADYEKVTFEESGKMAKVKEVGPPTPISPANMAPIFTSGESKAVDFSWSPMTNAAGYRLRVSRNPFFSSTILDRRVPTAEVQVSGLTEGAYYWEVQSYDPQGKESMESEKNRFTIINKQVENEAMNLELDPFVQHGHVIEVTGKTESGARVMVNGREVPMIATDGTFHYFTPPLPIGESVITITAQNSRGGVNTQQKKVVIQ